MVKTAVYQAGQLIGYVIWSGKYTESPVNISRYYDHNCSSYDVS